MEDAGEILVLEDEILIALDIEATLRDVGYDRIRLCSSATEARECLDGRLPRAALLDVNLGRGETSFELGKELHERGCPIVFMTGHTKTTVDFPEELRAAHHLSKPFRDRELLEIVTEVVPL